MTWLGIQRPTGSHSWVTLLSLATIVVSAVGLRATDTLESRTSWWSFQPIQFEDPAVPVGHAWSEHPIDQFVLSRLVAQDLVPNPRGGDSTLVRRLSFALTGLPPTPQELEAYLSDKQPGAYDRLVDRYLHSKHFGERWARHWMDWIRYAESHGSEGDPSIENAWHYRDYLIRALNADVPYDQLVREHIAGDLLSEPRINRELGINESLIGPAHWRMVFHGFAPTDALDERVRFTDDQINTFSKAFLGLTISCARCHDHKFDPISQKDYYALFGILGSCRPGRSAIELPEIQDRNREQLAALKPRIRRALADDWLASVEDLRESLLRDDGPWIEAEDPGSLLHAWNQLKRATDETLDFSHAWQEQVAKWQRFERDWQDHPQRSYAKRWDLSTQADYNRWFAAGRGLPAKPCGPGEFALAAEGEQAVVGIYPAGIYSHRLSAKHPARLTSPDIQLDDEYELWLQVIGQNGATTRYVVQNYPRDGTVYPVQEIPPQWRWQRFDLDYWEGDDIHVELTAAMDAPLLVKGQARSWFGVREVVIIRKGTPPPGELWEHVVPLLAASTASPPASFDDLAEVYADAVAGALRAWKDGSASDAEARLLHQCLVEGLLPNDLASLPSARPPIEEYRQLEEEVPVPTRVPGLQETVGRDHPLFERGDHRLPAAEVPRRFIEAIDPSAYQTSSSGRLRLAEDVLRDDNPLTRRVIVNRIWHHLFGRGLVPTCDNFGKLGDTPSHPELLDYLATRFAKDGWSIKRMIRLMVTSQTWQMDSRFSSSALKVDPTNRWLSRAHVRRLEAEAVRDSMLAISGRLQLEMFGPPVGGDTPRRSVYLRVQRNALDPFLRVFDWPEPFACTGRRDSTNVPAQSLTMMNDPLLAECAASWGKMILEDDSLTTDRQRVEHMFGAGLARPPRADEVAMALEYLAELRRMGTDASEPANEATIWTNWAHAMLNFKEFVYLR